MRKIKRLVEFFDDEDFRSQYEIPYLKGEMPEVISKFKNYDSSEDVRFLDAVRFQFPALNLFHYKDTKKGEFTIHGNCIIWEYNLDNDVEEIEALEVDSDELEFDFESLSSEELLREAYVQDFELQYSSSHPY